MPGRILQTDAWVLLKRPAAETFRTFSVFSADEGLLTVLQRLPKKGAGDDTQLDLFDEAALLLESSNEGRTWFVREVRLRLRPAAIGRSYDALRFASDLAALVARNPAAAESRAPTAELLRTALAAFGSSPRPDVVYFKSLYLFARAEGYPVRQQWADVLPPAERTAVAALLNRPLSAQTAPAAEVARLQLRLNDYLRAYTEILLG